MTRGFGSESNPRDGDRVKIEVDLEGGVVMEARVTGSGCEVSTKASAALTRLVRGRARSEALGIAASDLTAQIGPVDDEHERCVLTAIGALRAAIVDAHVRAIA
ncbi:MAG TPA: iron-sulfur cluster assembly scaffold protein [Verrucomicrobiae bacterium]|nr:iron-sulfur cluster assembly scaffold protein [Verrucomicrobiae bacterium]